MNTSNVLLTVEYKFINFIREAFASVETYKNWLVKVNEEVVRAFHEPNTDAVAYALE